MPYSIPTRSREELESQARLDASEQERKEQTKLFEKMHGEAARAQSILDEFIKREAGKYCELEAKFEASEQERKEQAKLIHNLREEIQTSIKGAMRREAETVRDETKHFKVEAARHEQDMRKEIEKNRSQSQQLQAKLEILTQKTQEEYKKQTEVLQEKQVELFEKVCEESAKREAILQEIFNHRQIIREEVADCKKETARMRQEVSEETSRDAAQRRATSKNASDNILVLQKKLEVLEQEKVRDAAQRRATAKNTSDNILALQEKVELLEREKQEEQKEQVKALGKIREDAAKREVELERINLFHNSSYEVLGLFAGKELATATRAEERRQNL